MPFLKSRNFRVTVVAGFIILLALHMFNTSKIHKLNKKYSALAKPAEQKETIVQEPVIIQKKEEMPISMDPENIELAPEEEIESVITKTNQEANISPEGNKGSEETVVLDK